MACRSMGSFFSRNFQSSGATPHRFSVGPNHHRPPFTDPTPPLTETHAPRSRGPHTSRGGGAGLALESSPRVAWHEVGGPQLIAIGVHSGRPMGILFYPVW
ncbi:hypothetical protein BHM03_00018859 [Ensete ventricosum]|nr:hypothetical protein BHM03_00018859 [Ensete ventricosum]